VERWKESVVEETGVNSLSRDALINRAGLSFSLSFFSLFLSRRWRR